VTASWRPSLTRLAAVFFALVLTRLIGISLTRIAGDISVLWLATGFLLAALLTAPRRHWPAYLICGYIASIVSDQILGISGAAAVMLSFCGPIEALIAACLLRPMGELQPDIMNPRALIRLGLAAALMAPALTALIGASILQVLGRASFEQTFLYWFLADALGIATVTPLLLLLARSHRLADLFRAPERWRNLALLGSVAAVSILVFSQHRYPALFLTFPPLILVVFQIGSAGGVLGIGILITIAIGFTLAHTGPLILISGHMPERVLFLQFYLVTAFLTTIPVAVTVDARKRLTHALDLSEGRYRLLADHAGDVILHIGLDGIQHYASPSITDILGWEPQELHGRSILDLVHPDHQASLQMVLDTLAEGQGREILSHLSRSRNGNYIWLETVFSLIREQNTGTPAEIVAVTRDISRRKQVEEQLADANRHLEVLASTDGLTGIANRRRFDAFLTHEWRRGARTVTPISLLLIDLDHFKAFNDHYGHMTGDDCLKAVGDAVQQIARRSADLAARYGGEEFALILADTDAAGAQGVATRLLKRIAELGITHAGSPYGKVTASIGFASAVPTGELLKEKLIEAADRALYDAKHSGRNRISSADSADAIVT